MIINNFDFNFDFDNKTIFIITLFIGVLIIFINNKPPKVLIKY
jgi:hypothetical protein